MVKNKKGEAGLRGPVKPAIISTCSLFCEVEAMKLKRAVWSVLKFELVWKLLTLIIISPLFDQVYQTYVSSVGVSFNANVLGTFLNLKGALIFLALFLAAGLLAFYELSVVIRLAALSRQGEVFSIRHVMKQALWSLRAMKGWSVVPSSLYYLLLLPLVQTVYFNSLVPALSIPWFILGEMQNSAIGVAGIIAIYAAYYGLYLLLFFVPLYMSLRGERFGSAVKSGLGAFRRLGLKRWALLLTGLAAWVLGDSELARYWRRNTLENMDFDRYFLKYLVYSEAFRIDLCYWLVTTLLQTAAMAFCLYFILSWLLSKENLRIPLESPWSEDSQTILAIWSKRWARWAAAWKRLWTKKRWKAAAGAACLMLAGYLVINCYQPPLLQAPLVIGHRGSIYGIENTLPAVQAAADLNADYAEVDIQLTADGVPVAVHDSNLWRLGGRLVNVADLTLEELRAIPLTDLSNPGETGQAPTLEELIQFCLADEGGMGLLIELKPAAGQGEALAQAILALVERYDFGERAMFMSLDYPCLAVLHQAHPEWWVGYCAYASAGDIDGTIWQYDIDFLAVEENLVSNQLVTQAREWGLPVYVWTVYDTDKMEQYLQMGVTGLISDWPDLASAVVERYNASHGTDQYLWQGEGYPKGDFYALADT